MFVILNYKKQILELCSLVITKLNKLRCSCPHSAALIQMQIYFLCDKLMK